MSSKASIFPGDSPRVPTRATACVSSEHSPTFLDDSLTDDRTRDLKGPFNYFLTPSDAIGFMDSPKAFQLTGDGAYSTFWGELTVWAGTPLKRLNITIPFSPVADDRTEQIKAVSDAKFDDYLARSSCFWQQQLHPETIFVVPEKKVMEMHKASLMYDLMARDLQEAGKSWIQTFTRQLDIKWTRKTTHDLSYEKGVELYVDKYWKIQRGEKIPAFDSRWIFPE